MKSKTINILVVLASIFIILSCSNSDDNIKIVTKEDITFKGIELEILSLVNIHRETNGLEKVSSLNQPYSEAINHTSYMIAQGKISHDNFEIRKSNLMSHSKAKVILENVAQGYSTADDVLNAWLTSPAHRLIIENPEVQYMGISAKQNSLGIHYYTQIFIGL